MRPPTLVAACRVIRRTHLSHSLAVTGFDTLVFSHEVGGEGQLFLDLASGIGMFGNGQVSPLVQFAEIGNALLDDLDWERVETEGSSNDFVIVGGGIESADVLT